MNIDLEPYIYRPHPIYRLPSREDPAVACQTKAGEKSFRDAMYQRGMRIYREVVDPFRCGHEPDHWKTADKLLDESEPVEKSTEEAGDTEHVLSQEESETESEAEAEPEQDEPEGEQDEPEWLQRRIDRFTRKLRLAEEERDEFEKEVTQLRSQVDQVPAAVQQNGNPVAHIKKESELNKIAELAERRLQFAEDMEDALLDNPERVEKVLRQQGVELADEYYPNIVPLFLQNHPDANRVAELDFGAGELEFAGVLIDAKHCYVV